jgi:glycosyltransferase involved in cell wall biosynthesis
MVALYLWRLRSQYDTVYFLMQGLHLVTGLPVARLLGKPIFMKVSGSGLIPLMQKTPLGRLELKWLQRWARVLMVLNEGMVEEALRAGLCRGQIIWVPNPVDIEEFRPRSSEQEADELRDRFGIPLRARAVIYVGRLSHEKGLISLLHGFAQAARTVPDSLLLLVGDGPQRAELERIAAELELGADKVRFVGYIDIKQVPMWLRCSDVFALVSPAEGLSCALLEAMAAGLASVVSAIPANVQLIEDGVHGLTVPFDDNKAIGEAFALLLASDNSRSRMGEEARRRAVSHYSTPKVVDRYEAIFEANRETLNAMVDLK